MTKLKPCPLCGGQAEYFATSQIRSPWSGVGGSAMGTTIVCKGCGCTIPSKMSTKDAEEAWNLRTVIIEDYGIEDGWRFVKCDDGMVYWRKEERTCSMTLREDIRGHAYQDIYECSECGEQAVRDTVIGESVPPNYCPNCGAKVVE